MPNPTVSLPTDCAVPDWLATCLLNTAEALHSMNGNGHQTPESDNGNGTSVKGHSPVSTVGLDSQGCDLVSRAFEFAYALHKGQKRASGEPYICHPIEVACLLRELGGDSAMIAAGFLHDVVEDTDVTPDEIEELYAK